jgi:hypothetical protein
VHSPPTSGYRHSHRPPRRSGVAVGHGRGLHDVAFQELPSTGIESDGPRTRLATSEQVVVQDLHKIPHRTTPPTRQQRGIVAIQSMDPHLHADPKSHPHLRCSTATRHTLCDGTAKGLGAWQGRGYPVFRLHPTKRAGVGCSTLPGHPNTLPGFQTDF